MRESELAMPNWPIRRINSLHMAFLSPRMLDNSEKCAIFALITDSLKIVYSFANTNIRISLGICYFPQKIYQDFKEHEPVTDFLSSGLDIIYTPYSRVWETLVMYNKNGIIILYSLFTIHCSEGLPQNLCTTLVTTPQILKSSSSSTGMSANVGLAGCSQ